MSVPFQYLHVSGDIILAAQGDGIHAFGQGFTLLSTWRHPGKQGGEKVDERLENGSKEPMTEGQDSPAGEGPPSKRRKLEDGEQEIDAGEAMDGDEGQAPEDAEKQSEAKSEESGKQKNSRRGKKGLPRSREGAYSQPPERSLVLSLNSTSDGRHVVAVTGSDKTIWVFEHDGKGHLRELSQRTMSKRPSSLCLTLDEETILCTDKFGDLYSLPLIPKSSPPAASTPGQEPSAASSPSEKPVPAAPQPFKPQASVTTVHIKRNRMALENQLKARAAAPTQTKEVPNFEHTLLLGHVSMATGVLMLKDPATGRPFIVTADRDEHIRVSRGVLSQAYIIDHFCFGHEDFISCIEAVPGRSELLLSAGGDDELFMWNWTTGKLLAKRDVLEHVMKVVPGADKIAVSGLCAHAVTHGGEEAHWVFVLCERVPAVFCFRIVNSNDLQYTQTVPLTGIPVSMAWMENGPGGLLVSVDTNIYPSQSDEASAEPGKTPNEGAANPLLQVLKKGESEWRIESLPLLAADLKMDMKPDELQKQLYTVENLRKYGMGDEA